ncbi:DUF4157 domain-containing protein [Algoriphagus zhangzhouensis]|uniref:eCIS core domain-containing protein n=1 Tax=Algoriphagus zhangzhouensis TaxID=1073327 RepID=A0A1M7ZBE6_9BACT|nr:DUF4157 domain-containing protein [Algoriphagus zhangzhouensis]TDY46810.1 uncharacterized protein DUF4157 [Algoriphagus zhangzhouensis]SHO62231.1 protein of unknown function [Algoriphagus zhangzhouensis]
MGAAAKKIAPPKSRLFGAGAAIIQPSLKVGKPGDKYEKEADSVADQVMMMPSTPQTPIMTGSSGGVQLEEEEEAIQPKSEEEKSVQMMPLSAGISMISLSPEEEEELQLKEEEEETVQLKGEEEESLQMMGGNGEVPASVSTQIQGGTGGGSPMAPAVQSEMGQKIGADFSGVKIHTGPQATSMSNALGAQAFTHGSDVYFNEGKYSPESSKGKHLLAHELTHTIQQKSAVVQRMPMVQKEEEEEEEIVKTNEFSFTVGRPAKTYSINTENQTATFPTLGVPGFKVRYGPGRGESFKKTVRSGTHIESWESDAMTGSGFTSDFEEKIHQENPPQLEQNDNPIYYLTLRGNRGAASSRRGESGVIFGTEAQIKRRLTRPYWNASGEFKPHDVDHKRELQLGGDETDTGNLWMLESSANRSSGSLINNEINARIRTLLTGSSENLISPPSHEAVKENYTITLTEGVSRGRGMRLPSDANANQNWTLERIKQGRQLRGLRFLTEAQVSQGGFRGSPNELMIYTNVMGGLPIRIPWSQEALDNGGRDGLESLNLFIGKRGGARMIINAVRYQSTTSESEGEGGNGSIRVTAFPGSTGLIEEKTDLVFEINRKEGVQYGGVISRSSTESAMERVLEFKPLSPITLTSVELNDDIGMVASGTIAPTVPFIGNSNIQITINEEGVRISKIFTASDFSFPSPFDFHNSSLEIFAGTDGIGLEGIVNFGIQSVGEGHIGAAASTSGGFELEGAFNFDSELFDPAEIRVEYKNEIWTIGGTVGIPEGKIRGVKSATINATYSENVFAAEGEAELDIPGIERGRMSIEYGENGFSIGGSFNLSSEVPGITGGSVEARVSKTNEDEEYHVFVTGTAQPDIPGINSTLTVTYEDGALTIEGSADYSRGMLSGSVNVGATNRAIGEDGQPSGDPTDTILIYGGGSLTLQITPWLAATAEVQFLPNGELEVTARLSSDEYEVFGRREVNRNLFRAPTIEIPIFAIPLGPRSIGLVAQIGGGLDFTAGFGPGALRNMSAEITYNPERENETTLNGHGEFVIPADAGLTLRGDLSLGVSAGIASLTGGIELEGSLGLEGEALASVDVNWSPLEGLTIDALGRITVNPKFVFALNAFARASLGIGWFSISETWRHNLASYEWGPDIQFGIVFPIHYREGEAFSISFDDLEVIYPDLDIINMASGLARDVKDDIF